MAAKTTELHKTRSPGPKYPILGTTTRIGVVRSFVCVRVWFRQTSSVFSLSLSQLAAYSRTTYSSYDADLKTPGPAYTMRPNTPATRSLATPGPGSSPPQLTVRPAAPYYVRRPLPPRRSSCRSASPRPSVAGAYGIPARYAKSSTASPPAYSMRCKSAEARRARTPAPNHYGRPCVCSGEPFSACVGGHGVVQSTQMSWRMRWVNPSEARIARSCGQVVRIGAVRAGLHHDLDAHHARLLPAG